MRFLFASVWCGLALLGGCGQSAPPKPAEAPPKPSAPGVPQEIVEVAKSVLGSEAEVIAANDLARNGKRQALVVNRLPKTPEGVVPGTLVTRAVIVENDAGLWKEIFRCDEHLKNPSGFLGGTPVAPVTGWRLQYEQNPEKGMTMFLTPLNWTASAHAPTIGVRWNPKVKRYQSLDRNFERFLGELPSLEGFNSRLK